jgi:ABC-type lipoprotein release transport system permease subunit
MWHLIEIAGTGLVSMLLHPLRSAVVLVALVVVLVPFLTGVAVARGLEESAEASVEFGADLYVTGTQLGRVVPLPTHEAMTRISGIAGVREVVPRCVGAIVLGKDTHAVLVGMPPEHFPAWVNCVAGRLPKEGTPHELVIGTGLAEKLGLKVGAFLPPFYRNEKQGERTSQIVGLFQPQTPLWQSHLILTTFETACFIFGQPDRTTDLLITCEPGAQDDVRTAVERVRPITDGDGTHALRLRVLSREELLNLLPQGLLRREGIFDLHFVLVFIVAILVLLVTTGLGLSERRREIAILKATGWQTDQILVRGMAESLALTLAGTCLAVLLAWIWLRFLNAWGIASIFLSGVPAKPDFSVPFRLLPVPVLLAFIVALAIVMLGTVYSCWRAAIAQPREAMR